MGIQRFYKNHVFKRGLGGLIFVSLFLMVGMVLYRTYAVYESQENFNLIEGVVSDQNYDAMVSFYLEDESGRQTKLSSIPEGKAYYVDVTCSDGAKGVWDYEAWGPRIWQVTKTRTKCKLIFNASKYRAKVMDRGIVSPIVSEGEGLYEVDHYDAEITYTTNEEEIRNLKQTEYRYAGKNPDNYVLFNEELWRMIGLVNTPEGQKIKLIRNESIGDYSWDSTETINWGSGINEWSQAKLMKLLNQEAYYKKEQGICYNGVYAATVSCDFTDSGLENVSKEFIEEVTWNLGANPIVGDFSFTTLSWYNAERGSSTGKQCDTSDRGCSDLLDRTISWQGKVGLMYPSDYGYATSANKDTSREFCLTIPLGQWSEQKNCYLYDWLYHSNYEYWWTMAPVAAPLAAANVFVFSKDGNIYEANGRHAIAVLPVVYLKDQIQFAQGNGSLEHPYLISF